MPDYRDRMIDDLLAAQDCSCEFPSPIHSRLRGWHCHDCGNGCPPEQRNKHFEAIQTQHPDGCDAGRKVGVKIVEE